MTVARIWIAGIDKSRGEDYERFAREISLPMFKEQEGFEGALMLRNGGDCVVLTLWASEADADALDASARYREAVSAIMKAGFISGEQSLERLSVHLVDMNAGCCGNA